MNGNGAERRWWRWRRAGLVAAVAVAGACSPEADIERTDGFAQGTTWSVQWAATPSAPPGAMAAALNAELERLDALLSNYRSDSAVERFNATRSTAPLAVPAELAELLAMAASVHHASDGCFDPTVKPLVAAWGFDGPEPRIPDEAALAAARELVGLDKLQITTDGELRKALPDVAVDVSGIAQGYSAERLGAVVESFGVASYLVEIGGEIFARGFKPGGEPWRVAIAVPDAGAAGRVLSLPERATAVATSGTYEHYFEDPAGRRYAHVLDPHTGAPVAHALVSVTVLHSSGALADAWSTALLCLGPDRGAAVAAREQLAASLIVDRDGRLEEWSNLSLAADTPAF